MIAINTPMIAAWDEMYSEHLGAGLSDPGQGKSRTEKLCYCLVLRGSGVTWILRGLDGRDVTFTTGNKVEPWTIGTDTLKGVKHFLYWRKCWIFPIYVYYSGQFDPKFFLRFQRR